MPLIWVLTSFKAAGILPVVECRAWVRIPLETYIFILNFWHPSCSEQLSLANANEIKHDHSPVVIVVLDPR